MSISDYVRRLARRWRVILAVTAVVLALAGLMTWQMDPTYESRAQLYVAIDNPDSDMGTALAAGVYAQQKVLSYAAVATSERMGQTVKSDLRRPESAAVLASKFKVSVPYGTVLIDLVVQDGTAKGAQALALSLVNHYNFVLEGVDDTTKQRPVRVSVLASPSLSTTPVSPNIPLNLLAGLFAGLLLGLGAAALRDVLDNTVKNAHDVESAGLALLGALPVAGRKERSQLIAAGDRTALAEALRQVRVNLQYASIDNPPKTFVVTSCVPGEGKSFVAANLAAAFAQAGSSVVVVDADLRRPMIATRFGVPSGVGLTTALVKGLPLREAVQTVNGVDVLASGSLPPNPSDLLGSEAMAELTKQLEADYDMVIFDTPPMLAFADAKMLAHRADAVILVTSYAKSGIEKVVAATEQLREVGGTVVGTVINRSKLVRDDAYGYYGAPHKA